MLGTLGTGCVAVGTGAGTVAVIVGTTTVGVGAGAVAVGAGAAAVGVGGGAVGVGVAGTAVAVGVAGHEITVPLIARLDTMFVDESYVTVTGAPIFASANARLEAQPLAVITVEELTLRTRFEPPCVVIVMELAEVFTSLREPLTVTFPVV